MDATILNIAGIPVHLLGQRRVDGPSDLVIVLHGRTQSVADVATLASTIFERTGALVASFDHRNHGHRLLDPKANTSWIEGNTNHAQDMFGILYGTSSDVSDIISLLPMFLSVQFKNIFCVGVSLGGHSTYFTLSNDPRINAGVVIIGCPDVGYLMQSRALESGQELPPSFIATAKALGASSQKIAQKDLLVLKGNQDTLVPWEPSESFLTGDKFTVKGYECGHAVTEEMIEDAAEWIHQICSKN